MEVTFLDLQATTPLELYFEVKLKGVEEEFMMAFVIAGYTEDQLNQMNSSLDSMKKLADGGLSIIEAIATKLGLLNEFNKIKQGS